MKVAHGLSGGEINEGNVALLWRTELCHIRFFEDGVLLAWYFNSYGAVSCYGAAPSGIASFSPGSCSFFREAARVLRAS